MLLEKVVALSNAWNRRLFGTELVIVDSRRAARLLWCWLSYILWVLVVWMLGGAPLWVLAVFLVFLAASLGTFFDPISWFWPFAMLVLPAEHLRGSNRLRRRFIGVEIVVSDERKFWRYIWGMRLLFLLWLTVCILVVAFRFMSPNA